MISTVKMESTAMINTFVNSNVVNSIAMIRDVIRPLPIVDIIDIQALRS
jgi:hypothetical protein